LKWEVDQIDEFLNSLSIDESPIALGDSQVEWDDDIVFDHANFVPQDQLFILILMI